MAKPKRLFSDTEQKLIIALYQEGKTDQEVADIIGVPRTTLRDQVQYNAIIDPVSKAKSEADNKVEEALFKRAIGYEHPEDKIFNDNGEALIVPTIKHYPPDPVSAIFWLKNRRPEAWKDKQEITQRNAPSLRMQDLQDSMKAYHDQNE